MSAPAQVRGGTISVLDIGSSKMCCMIARSRPREERVETTGRTHDIEVLGVGHQRTSGVRAGAVVDVSAAEGAIRQVVETAERLSGLTVGSLIVNVSSTTTRSERHHASVDVGGEEIEAADVSRVVRAALRGTGRADRTVLHSIPSGFSIDGEDEVANPEGMIGRELSVTCHTASVANGPAGNVERAVNRAHLDVASLVATPYAAALAAAVEDETEMGCAVIDMGAGTTSWSIHARGRFLGGETLAVGGHHVTTDLARGLSTSIEAAERLKVLEASVAAGPASDESIAVRGMGDAGSAAVARVPRALVSRIAVARLEETFELVRDRIRASGLGREADRRVVLTGGAAQLTGVADVARRVLARNVRVGRPIGVSGLAPVQKTPAFSTAVGLLIYPQVARFEHAAERSILPADGRLARLGQWFRGF